MRLNVDMRKLNWLVTALAVALAALAAQSPFL
jgi:hypothetical protein